MIYLRYWFFEPLNETVPAAMHYNIWQCNEGRPYVYITRQKNFGVREMRSIHSPKISAFLDDSENITELIGFGPQ